MKEVWRKRRGGFTLIEVLIVCAIIGLLAALLVVGLANLREKARESKTKGFIGELKTALERYKKDFDDYPSSTTPYTSSRALHYFLGSFLTKYEYSGSRRFERSVGPYIQFSDSQVESRRNARQTVPPQRLIDGWGNPIEYVYPYNVGTQPYRIRSMGGTVRGAFRFDDGNDIEDVQ